MISELSRGGWRKGEAVEDPSDIKEEQLYHIFKVIDKDNSGYLSQKVKHREEGGFLGRHSNTKVVLRPRRGGGGGGWGL